MTKIIWNDSHFLHEGLASHSEDFLEKFSHFVVVYPFFERIASPLEVKATPFLRFELFKLQSADIE